MRKALIVDDNAFHANLMREILETMGFHVIARDDPAGVVDLVSEILPDLLVMDVRLPGLSGLTLLRRIKDVDPRREIPVIVVTALPFKESDPEIRASGAEAFLEKPLDPAAFIATVRELVG
jgi:CheY-like chemotaxis protein